MHLPSRKLIIVHQQRQDTIGNSWHTIPVPLQTLSLACSPCLYMLVATWTSVLDRRHRLRRVPLSPGWRGAPPKAIWERKGLVPKGMPCKQAYKVSIATRTLFIFCLRHVFGVKKRGNTMLTYLRRLPFFLIFFFDGSS